MENKKVKNEIDIAKIISENKQFIIIVIIYIVGLLSGTLIYKSLNTDAIREVLDKLVISESISFVNIFLQKLIVYLCVYILTVVFALSVIGYPTINIIPFLCGFEVSIKLSYYYNLYNIKGIGYSLLLNAPEISAFILVMIFAINKAGELSKKIFQATFKQNFDEIESAKSCFKNFIIYGAAVVIVAVMNSAIEFFLNSVVSI